MSGRAKDSPLQDRSHFMTPAEVAGVLRVDRKTATRWGLKNQLDCIRLPGQRGDRRFFRAEVNVLLAGGSREDARRAAEKARAELGLPPRTEP